MTDSPTAAPATTAFTPSQLAGNSSGTAPLPVAKPAPSAPATAPVVDRALTTAEKLTGVVSDAEPPAAPFIGDDTGEDVAPLTASDEDAAPDPLAEMIHGKTARELLEALKSDTLVPEDLLDVLEYEFGDDKQRVKLRDALAQDSKERMQLADYHRNLKKVRDFEAEISSRANALQEFVTGLNNGDTLVDDLRSLNISEDNLEKALKKYAVERAEYNKLPPHMRQILDQSRAQAARAAKLERDLQALQMREQKVSGDMLKRTAAEAIDQHMAPAMKKFGLNPKSRIAIEKFKVFASQMAKDGNLTRDVIYGAAEAASQDLHRIEREEAGEPPAPARKPFGKPLSPSRAAPAATGASAPSTRGQPKAFTPSQLASIRGR